MLILSPKIRNYLILCLGLLSFIVALNIMSDNVSADNHIWIADNTQPASNINAWNNGIVPENGDDISYTIDHNGNCNWDLAITLNDIVINGYTGTFTQGLVNFGYNDFSISSGIFSGNVGKIQSCSGFWNKTGGTISSATVNLIMNGPGCTLNSNGVNLNSLRISSNILLSSSITLQTSFTIDSDCTLTTNAIITWKTFFAGASYINNGTISGSGSLQILFSSTDATLSLGVVNCNIEIRSEAYANADRTLKLASNTIINGRIWIYSYHASFTMSLNLNSHDLTSNGILIETRGKLIPGNRNITNLGNWDSTTGIWLPEQSKVITNGVSKTIKMGVGQSLYDWIVTNESSVSLLSNVNVTHQLDPWGIINKGAFTLIYSSVGLYYISSPVINIIYGDNYNYQIDIAFDSYYSILPTFEYFFNSTELEGSSSGFIMGRPNGIGPISVEITTIDQWNNKAYQNYTLNVMEQSIMIDETTLITIVWLILMITFLVIGVIVGRWWSFFGGLIWIFASLTTFIVINTVVGILLLGVGMLLIAFGLGKIVEG